MDGLISRAAAIDALTDTNLKRNVDSVCDGDMNRTRRAAQRVIAQLPAVDAVPVVHARWITYPECLAYDGAYHDEHIVCSACHSVWNIIDNDTERFDHCPACGANMDGEQKEANDGNSNNP